MVRNLLVEIGFVTPLVMGREVGKLLSTLDQSSALVQCPGAWLNVLANDTAEGAKTSLNVWTKGAG
ncbi:hypothetical protein [Mesorhizobium sp. ORM16]|uniref:hypothetical protein n=1 Tax=Mesorhizobium sp. ORM16 TaxID=3376989 RepID=UPI003857A137